MAERHDVLIKVVSQTGKCEQEHKVGEEWVLGAKIPAGICFSAFATLLPNARVLMFGASFPWENDPEVSQVACPDPHNPVVFELKRLPKR